MWPRATKRVLQGEKATGSSVGRFAGGRGELYPRALHAVMWVAGAEMCDGVSPSCSHLVTRGRQLGGCSVGHLTQPWPGNWHRGHRHHLTGELTTKSCELASSGEQTQEKSQLLEAVYYEVVPLWVTYVTPQSDLLVSFSSIQLCVHLPQWGNQATPWE